jgi:hypothetical protein
MSLLEGEGEIGKRENSVGYLCLFNEIEDYPNNFPHPKTLECMLTKLNSL